MTDDIVGRLRKAIGCELHIIQLHVAEILANVPMVTKQRNAMQDIRARCETIRAALTTKDSDHA